MALEGLEGLGKLANSMDRFADDYQNKAGDMLGTIGDEFTELERDYSPVLSGELEDSWDGIQQSWDEYISKNEAPHVIPVNNGHVTPSGGFVPPEHMVEQAIWDIEDKLAKSAQDLISWKVIEHY